MIDLKGNPFYLSDKDIKWVETTKASMSMEEKLEQLFFCIGLSPDRGYLNQEILPKRPGGIMFRAWGKEALAAAGGCVRQNAEIPTFIAANLESGGDGFVLEGTPFGKQMQVAATDNPENAYRLGKVSCSEAKAAGCNCAFAPVADIDLNYHNPITNVRTYGSDPETVRKYALEYIRAAKECKMAATAKHFPGDGVDEVDQHILISVNSLSCEEWDKTYGYVYRSLIGEGVLAVMAGHIAQPAYQEKISGRPCRKLVPASLSKELLQGLLRDRLHFNGMILTDASTMVGFMAAMDRRQAVPYCIEAGCDMLLFSKDYEEDLTYMREGLEKGILSKERLEEAVTRILAVKAAVGLHLPASGNAAKSAERQADGETAPSEHKNEKDLSVIGCAQHLAWARECAKEAVTLVKDTQGLLPISPEKHRRVLFEILGKCASEKRVAKTFLSRMEQEGFKMIPYEEEVYDMSGPMKLESVEEFRSKYDLVIYIGNVENESNKTTCRLNWHSLFGMGNNIPWFVETVPTLFISLQNPYHLLDVPMVKTYINAYSNHDIMIETVIDKILGKEPFTGKSPSDPFCGKDYMRY